MTDWKKICDTTPIRLVHAPVTRPSPWTDPRQMKDTVKLKDTPSFLDKSRDSRGNDPFTHGRATPSNRTFPHESGRPHRSVTGIAGRGEVLETSHSRIYRASRKGPLFKERDDSGESREMAVRRFQSILQGICEIHGAPAGAPPAAERCPARAGVNLLVHNPGGSRELSSHRAKELPSTSWYCTCAHPQGTLCHR